jgi:hypothetical protein
MLNSYKEGFGFPLGLLLPNSPGKISTILGLGIFSFFFVNLKNKKTRKVLVLAFLTFVTTALFCQRTSRFFIDAYYIVLLAFIISPVRKKWFNIFNKLLTFQVIGVTACAIMGVYLLFPGCLSLAQREKVLERSANDYSAMKYLDNKLPKKAFIISDFRSNALIPRSFFAINYPFMIKYFPKEFIKRLNEFSNLEGFYATNQKIRKSNILYNSIGNKKTIFKPNNFFVATRNPFNKKPYTLYVYKIDINKLKDIAISYINSTTVKS